VNTVIRLRCQMGDILPRHLRRLRHPEDLGVLMRESDGILRAALHFRLPVVLLVYLLALCFQIYLLYAL
jgi:hypothetical protein